MEGYKVVFHINESPKWSTLLANVKNLVKDMGSDRIIIEVLANGAAVTDYISDGESDNELAAKIQEISKMGVVFAACRNSLSAYKIDEKLLPEFVTVVAAGVTELVKKQAEGYAYIKP